MAAMKIAKKTNDPAAVLERGQQISAELYRAAISAVYNAAEAVGEDAQPTIHAITIRYEALLAAAEAVTAPLTAPPPV